MPLSTQQELRKDLLLFALTTQCDLDAAIALAIGMEKFILEGGGSDGATSVDSDRGGWPDAPAHPSGDPSPASGRPFEAGRAPAGGGLAGSGLAGSGLAGGEKRRWSAQDDDLLKERWHSTQTLESLSEEMGRTIPSLYCRARALGLAKRAAGSAGSSNSNEPPPEEQESLPGTAGATVASISRSLPRRAAPTRQPEPSRIRGEGAGGSASSAASQPEDQGIEQVIHFLRSRDYSVTRVGDGRFKLDGRRILTSVELREKADHVRKMLGQCAQEAQTLQSAG